MNYLGFKEEKLSTTAASLNKLLANCQVYYQNLRNFHWNIHGQHFFDLHDKFEELYNDAKIHIDEIAERLLTLRFTPLSTLKAYLEFSEIKETETSETDEMVKAILYNHKVLIDLMRETIREASEVGDEGTVDLLSGYLGGIEKKSWMLDAWLMRSQDTVIGKMNE